jgi:hypothetical protein
MPFSRILCVAQHLPPTQEERTDLRNALVAALERMEDTLVECYGPQVGDFYFLITQ